MKVFIYSAKPFEIPLITKANAGKHELVFSKERLTTETALLALNFDAISVFSADDASPNVLEKLKDFGVKHITLRSAGYDNIALNAARKLKIRVANTPNYSPNAIAEHAITLLLSFNRHIVNGQKMILQHNFLLDNLIGFDLYGKKVGVLGTGRIGSVLVKILHGFGCVILANDTISNKQLIKEYGVEYISKDAIAKEVDILFICLPLTTATHHLCNEEYLKKMKRSPMIINVARGAIVDTKAILNALDTEQINGYATDVYEREHGVFFYDRSEDSIEDETFLRLLNHSQTLVTPHQAFATQEALQNIATTTIENLNAWQDGKHSVNELY